jgi:hypothetical protein
MQIGEDRVRVALLGLGTIALLLLLAGGRDVAASQTAQEVADGGVWSMGIGARTEGAEDPGHTFGARFIVTTEDGEYIGECTLAFVETSVPWHNCRVDVPSDRISLVWEDLDSIPAGYAPVENPIVFDPTTYETGPHNIGAIFRNVPVVERTAGTSDVTIVTTENGQPVFDVCYVLVGLSNEGCDDNGDGQVTFEDVPLGTHTVRQTADLGSGRYVDDVTIDVTGGTGPYPGLDWVEAQVLMSPASALAASGAVDVALITRDPDTGDLLTGACYLLADDSNEGCDENGDGQVTFADIPFGTYTVRQTQAPAGYPTVNDYDIVVEPVEGLPGERPREIPLGFVVKQAPEQNAPDTRNVSVVIFDTRNGMRDASGVCVELIGGSELGCDEDLPDGQVDFLDVPAGTYEICVFNFPEGWEWAKADGPTHVTVDASPGAPANQTVLLVQRHSPSLESAPETPCGSNAGAPASGADGSSASGTTGSSDSTAQGSWTASVQVNLCDAPPGSGREMNCHAEGGIVVDISLASGAWLGSCTVGEPQPTPWGVSISTCSIEGMPFNADLVATQDPSTIPAGYVPYEEILSLRVENLYPGGGDQATFTFFNVRTDAGATGPAVTSGSGSAAQATLLMTFRGCPEWFDPGTDDAFATCTIPLDAPDASFISWGGDGQGGMNIAWLDRQYDGAYVYTAGPATMNVQLSGLAPVVRNAYLVVGADSVSGAISTVNLANEETREVFVFYYNE